jgi:hypothetical protein
MKLRSFAVVAALTFATLAAHAQTGIYLNPVAIRVGNSIDEGPFAFLGQDVTSRVFYGYTLGVYNDFYHSGKLSAGLDARLSDLHANNAMLRSYLLGVRVTGSPFTRPIKPYAQISFGTGTTKAPASPVMIRKLDYVLYGGVDYTLHKHVDWRVGEIGYGQVTTISSANIGGGGTLAVPAANQISFSSGLVFRF